MADTPEVSRVEQALTLLVHSARVSPPLRDAVRLVEDDRRRLMRENDLLRTVAAKAKWLYDLVDRDAAAGDPYDLQCLKNHGLAWHQLDQALDALGMLDLGEAS